MAAYYGYEGQQGFSPVNTAISRKFGDTPGGTGQGAGMFSFQDGDKTKYFLPENYMAGNAWSSARPNADYIRSIGGMDYTTPTGSTTTRNTSNPYGQNYGEDVTKNWGGQKGWTFDQLPDWAKIENNSTFMGGRGTSNRSFNEGLLALAAAVTGGSALAGSGAGGTSAISGGGTLSSSAPTAGGALATGGSGGAVTGAGALGGSIPAYTPAMNAAGAAAGGNASIGGIGAAAGGAGAAGASGIPAWLSNAGTSIGNWASSPAGTYTGLGLADLGLRYKQGQDLKDIANESANRADAFQQQQRIPYQGLLSQYLRDGESIASQPYVKANMEFALDSARANQARTGRSGSGGAERELVDYTNKVFEANALPYLNQLSGMAGFGFGPGASGQLYGQYGSMATGTLPMGLESLARGYGLSQGTVQPWQIPGYNAQQQMMGMGPGRSWTLS